MCDICKDPSVPSVKLDCLVHQACRLCRIASVGSTIEVSCPLCLKETTSSSYREKGETRTLASRLFRFKKKLKNTAASTSQTGDLDKDESSSLLHELEAKSPVSATFGEDKRQTQSQTSSSADDHDSQTDSDDMGNRAGNLDLEGYNEELDKLLDPDTLFHPISTSGISSLAKAPKKLPSSSTAWTPKSKRLNSLTVRKTIHKNRRLQQMSAWCGASEDESDNDDFNIKSSTAPSTNHPTCVSQSPLASRHSARASRGGSSTFGSCRQGSDSASYLAEYGSDEDGRLCQFSPLTSETVDSLTKSFSQVGTSADRTNSPQNHVVKAETVIASSSSDIQDQHSLTLLGLSTDKTRLQNFIPDNQLSGTSDQTDKTACNVSSAVGLLLPERHRKSSDSWDLSSSTSSDVLQLIEGPGFVSDEKNEDSWNDSVDSESSFFD